MNARKLFNENVAIAGTTAVSMETLLRNAGWGYIVDPVTNAIDTTQFSMDSFEGNGGSIKPAADIYVGHDEFVRNAAAAGPPRLYKGILVASGTTFNLADYCRGIVDASRIWFYAAGGATTADLVLDGF